jgi:hypothetical protein
MVGSIVRDRFQNAIVGHSVQNDIVRHGAAPPPSEWRGLTAPSLNDEDRNENSEETVLLGISLAITSQSTGRN